MNALTTEKDAVEFTLWTETRGKMDEPVRAQVDLCCQARSANGYHVVGIPDGNVLVFLRFEGENAAHMERIFDSRCQQMLRLFLSPDAETLCCIDAEQRVHFFRRQLHEWKEERVYFGAMLGFGDTLSQCAFQLKHDVLCIASTTGLQCFKRQTWLFGLCAFWHRCAASSDDSFVC